MSGSNDSDEVAATTTSLGERLAVLAAPTALLSAIFATAPVGLQIFAPDGRCVVVNPAFARLFGAAPPPDYNIFDDTILVERGVADLVRRGFAGEHISIPPLWYDARDLRNVSVAEGQRIAVSAEVVPLRSAEGAVEHVLFVFHDLTAAHDARERAEQAAAAAEHARSLAEAARAEAAQANRAKDEFLAMLGHELRNPLAPIVTALELTRARQGSSRERDVIERQIAHLRRLVDDLLDVARITSGKLQLSREPIEIAVPVLQGVELARPVIDDREHRLELHVPRTGLVVLGDRVRLAQVIGNLMINAARYTSPGGTIVLTVERVQDRVRVRVRDTGIGMSAELVTHVFERFTQGERTIDRAGGGLGLGLAIVRSIVELHEGAVAARSDGPGSGSEFEVTLPAVDREAARTSQGHPVEEGELPAGKRVLIVDDNVDAADLLAEALAGVGCEVRVANDPETALARARSWLPDVALLDIGLPRMDGFDLARQFRTDAALAATWLVAVTGYGQPADRERSVAAGFDHHLTKPVGITELRSLVAALTTRGRRGP